MKIVVFLPVDFREWARVTFGGAAPPPKPNRKRPTTAHPPI